MSTAADYINQFANIMGKPQLTKEVVEPQPQYQQQQQIPQFQQPVFSGIPTYGQPSGGILPSQWYGQPQRNPVEISDAEISDLAKLSVLFQVRVQQVITEGAKYFLIKVLRRNKTTDENIVEEHYNIEEPNNEQKQKYEDAKERLQRLDELESFESPMTIDEFEKLLIRLKTSELKQQRDNGTLELPTTWGVTFNLVGLNLSGMFGNNMKIFGDLVYAFKN